MKKPRSSAGMNSLLSALKVTTASTSDPNAPPMMTQRRCTAQPRVAA